MFFTTIVILFLLFLPIFYESPRFRYYFKHLVYYSILSVNGVILSVVFAVYRPFSVRNLVIGSYLSRPITHLIGIKWTLRNPELLEDRSSCVVISNHQHSLDILGMFQFWHIIDKMTVVAKKELLYAGPFGLAAWLCNLMFIDRKHGDQSRQQMATQMDQLIKEDIKLWIFPEGTRRNTNQIHDFKKGAFYLAIQKQIPIQPIVYSSYKHFLDSDQKVFDNGEIIMTALPRICTKDVKIEEMDKFIERVRQQMTDVYNATTAEAKANLAKNPMFLSSRLENLKRRIEGKEVRNEAGGDFIRSPESRILSKQEEKTIN